MSTPRKPIPHSDEGAWGSILNEFLSVSLADNGKLKSGSVTPGTIPAGSIDETKLDSDVRSKLNSGSGGSPTLQPHAASHAAGQSDAITPASIGAQPAGSYASALGSNDNYVTDAEKTKLASLSGVNTGDQVLPTWSSLNGKPAVIASGATQAEARVAIGAQPAGSYAPALGSDDNYVTDAEKVKLTSLSGVNTGDQVLPTWSTLNGKPAVIASGANQAEARVAIGAPDTARVEAVVVHDGTSGGGTRPAGFVRVRWVGGAARPTNMSVGDIWEHDA